VSNDRPRTQLVTLFERRDLAAYRAVSKIHMVLQFWEAEDFENAEQLLRSALAEFEKADQNVNQLYSQLNPNNEKRPANGITADSQRSAAS
jgi:hypothetical protein